MTTALHLSHAERWDMAGIDGLQVAQLLFGDRVNQIAPFQSLETTVEIDSGSIPCSILRLCEGNFRIVRQNTVRQNTVRQNTVSQNTVSQNTINQSDCSPLEQTLQQMQTQHRVWVKRFDWLSAIVMPESVGLTLLPEIAKTKPPYRLPGMAIDRAVPARIEGRSVLIWRHPVLEQPAFELHTATKDIETIKICLGL